METLINNNGFLALCFPLLLYENLQPFPYIHCFTICYQVRLANVCIKIGNCLCSMKQKDDSFANKKTWLNEHCKKIPIKILFCFVTQFLCYTWSWYIYIYIDSISITFTSFIFQVPIVVQKVHTSILLHILWNNLTMWR